MDWKVVLEVVSPVTIIFVAGMMTQQLAGVREEVQEFRKIVKEWASVLVRLGQLEHTASRNTSDIAELRGDLGRTREEMVSVHDT